jgi:hypothetical protein
MAVGSKIAFIGGESEELGEFSATTGTFSVTTGTTHGNSVGAYQSNPAAAATGYGEIQGRTAAGVLLQLSMEHPHLGFWFYVNSMPAAGKAAILARFISTGGDEAVFRMVNNGGLSVVDDVGVAFNTTIQLSTGTWYHVRIRVDVSNDDCEVQVGEDSDTDTTFTLSGSPITDIYVGHSLASGTYNTACDMVFDSIIVDQSFHPRADIVRLMPNANGTYTTWGASAGADWECVDEVPDDADGSYVSCPAGGYAAETVNLEPASTHSITEDIVAVIPWAQARWNNLAEYVQLRIRSGGTDWDGTNYALTSSYTNLQLVYLADPTDAAAWTTSKLDALEVGLDWVAGFQWVDFVRMTQCMACVAYVPDAGPIATVHVKGGHIKGGHVAA